jgi:hypothetical protein
MPLSEDQKQELQKLVAKCDAALSDKPMLSAVYDPTWRQRFRKKLLGVDKWNDIAFPGAYSAPLRLVPSDYQDRLEQGAAILLSKLSKKEGNHLVTRLRGDGCISAEDELLLARGFAIEFDNDAIVGPSGEPTAKRPEFVVNVKGHAIAIEAKALLDSLHTRLLGHGARLVGQNYWVSYCDTTVKDLKRVESAVKKKIPQVRSSGMGVIVFTQHTPWPPVIETTRLLSRLALHGKVSGLLAIAYVFQQHLQGVWLNPSVVKSSNVDDDLLQQLRKAITISFYPRSDDPY